MRHSRKRKNRRYLLTTIGIFFILIGSSVLIYRTIQNKQLEKIENESIEIFLNEEQQEEQKHEEQQEETKQEELKINYVAVLEIPKINLKKGLVDKNSKENNVDRNIYTLKESIFPNEKEYSQIILASHSGNSYVSHFRRLNELKLNDSIYLYYNNNKYTYKIIKKYEIEKNGTANLGVYKESNINLITCIDGTNKQLVIAGIIMEDE